MELGIVQQDLFLVFRIPQPEIIQPFPNLGILTHFRERLALYQIVISLFTQQPFIARKRLTMQYRIVDRNRLAHFSGHTTPCRRTIPFIYESIVLLDETDLIAFRLAVLAPERLAEIMQYLCLSQSSAAPLFVLHIRWLCFGIKPVQVLTALGVTVFQSRMYPDLVQHLFYRIGERFGRLALLRQFPQDFGAVFLQHGLRHLQQSHVDCLCRTIIDATGKIGVHLCVVSGRRFGICTLLLPELQLHGETWNAHLGKGVIRQQNLTKETEVSLHLPDR